MSLHCPRLLPSAPAYVSMGAARLPRAGEEALRNEDPVLGCGADLVTAVTSSTPH